MIELQRIDVEPHEDARDYRVGDHMFGRRVVRVDHERGVIWVEAPSRYYRFKHWLGRVWASTTGTAQLTYARNSRTHALSLNT